MRKQTGVLAVTLLAAFLTASSKTKEIEPNAHLDLTHQFQKNDSELRAAQGFLVYGLSGLSLWFLRNKERQNTESPSIKPASFPAHLQR